jgi:hypothetical protein
MFESVTPTPLAAIPPRGYNSRVTAKDTCTMRLTGHFVGRLKGVIGHGQESREIAAGCRSESFFTPWVGRHHELAEHAASRGASTSATRIAEPAS